MPDMNSENEEKELIRCSNCSVPFLRRWSGTRFVFRKPHEGKKKDFEIGIVTDTHGTLKITCRDCDHSQELGIPGLTENIAKNV